MPAREASCGDAATGSYVHEFGGRRYRTLRPESAREAVHRQIWDQEGFSPPASSPRSAASDNW